MYLMKNSALRTKGSSISTSVEVESAVGKSMLAIGFTILFLISFSGYLSAQSISRQVIGIAGGSLQQGQTNISWTLGESVIGHIQTKNGNGSITVGFQQPSLKVVDNQLIGDVLVNIAPNPVSDLLNIIVLDPQQDNLKFSLVDAQGRILMPQQKLGAWKNEFDMSAYPAGTYFLRVQNNIGKTSQTYKVLKIK